MIATWLLGPFPPGTRLADGQLSIHQEDVEQDSLIPGDRRTARILRAVANDITPMIVMEEDCQSNHPSGKLPILDLEVWVSGNTILHSFYKKSMASRKVIHAKSAFSTRVKRSILLEEGSRRLRNCSPDLDWRDKAVFLNRLSLDMKNCGHKYTFRKTILVRVVAKYMSSLSNHLEGDRPLYRSREEREKQKQETKALSMSDTWFRKSGATSTLCVPPTPGGALAKMVEKNLELGRQPAGTNTKVVEGNGTSSGRGLVKPNQFPRDSCKREDCLLCVQQAGEKETHCDRSNSGYEADCTRCEEKFKYIGETSRTGYTRIKEHFANYRTAAASKLPPLQTRVGPAGPGPPKDVKSFMWEHCRDYHGGQVGDREGIFDFGFKVSKTFQRCLQRQVDEGLRMKMMEGEGCVLLNTKNEWFTPKLVELEFKQQ